MIYKITKIGVALLLTFIAFAGIAVRNNKQIIKKEQNPFFEIDSLKQIGQYQAAYEKSVSLLDVFFAKKQEINFLKAFIYSADLLKYFSENPLDDQNELFIKWTNNQNTLTNKILYTLRAEQLQAYLQNRLYNQPNTQWDNQSVNPTDWSQDKIKQQITFYYLESLKGFEQNDTTTLFQLESLFKTERENRNLRPELFDFLCWRALSYYTQQPLEENNYDDNNLFNLTKNVILTDSTNVLQVADYLFQSIIKHNNLKPLPKLYNQLQYLKYLHNKSDNDVRDSIYENQLTGLINQNYKNENVVLAYYNLATHLVYTGSLKKEEHRWDIKKALAVLDKSIKNFPNNEFINESKNLKQTLLSPQLGVKINSSCLPNKKNILTVDFKNIKQLYYKIVSIPENELGETPYYYGKDGLKKILHKTPIIERKINLPLADDYQAHTTVLEENSLPIGNYLLVSSTFENFKSDSALISYTPFNVSNIYFATQTVSENKILLIATNRETGNPLPNAKVTISEFNYNYKIKKNEEKIFKELSTNEKGFAVIEFKQQYFSYKLKLTYNKETFTQSVYPNINNKSEVFTKSKIITDRIIYRPGQKVFVKGIIFSIDNTTQKTNQLEAVSLYLNDANGQIISSINLKTNTFGSYNHEFVLPEHLLNGTYTISDGYSEQFIQVEEYKRPKYDITFEKQEGEIKLNTLSQIKASVKALSGQPLINAKTEINVYRSSYPMFWGCYSYFPIPENNKLIESKTVFTNDTGGVIFNFTPTTLKTVKEKLLLNYLIKIKVTDITGETIEKEKTITLNQLGYQFNLQANIIDKNSYNIDEFSDTSSFVFKTTTEDVEPVNKELTVKVYSLITPSKPKIQTDATPDTVIKSFENTYTEITNTNPDNWKTDKKIQEIKIKSNQRYTIAKLFNNQTGCFKLEIYDSEQQLIYKNYASILNTKSYQPDLTWFSAYINAKNYQIGDTAEIQLFTHQPEGNVFYTLEETDITSRFQSKISYQWIRSKQHNSTIKLPIMPYHAGNFFVNLFYQEENQVFYKSITIFVPRVNKDLTIQAKSIRDNVFPGAKETWEFSIKDNKENNQSAECLASMYDASLDQLFNYTPNVYFFESNYPTYYLTSGNPVYTQQPRPLQYPALKFHPAKSYLFDSFLFDPFFTSYYYGRNRAFASPMASPMTSATPDEEYVGDAMPIQKNKKTENNRAPMIKDFLAENEKNNSYILNAPQTPRSNFNETAFFFPQLQSDVNGTLKFTGTFPESLTKWKLFLIAHNNTLSSGYYECFVQTNKPIMCTPNLPRTLKQNDKIILKTKVDNTTATEQKVTVRINIKNAISDADLNKLIKSSVTQTLIIKPKSSSVVSWEVVINEPLDLLKITIEANNQQYTDAEINYVPVLSNRILVTEALPMVADSTYNTFEFTSLKNNTSNTLQTLNYVLEYTANPTWNIIKYLPYLMEKKNESSEEIFSRYFANTLALKILDDTPEIENIFKQWENNPKESFTGNLAKNSELKQLLLSETPWVMQNKTEEEQKKQMAALFNRGRIIGELNANLIKLTNNQLPNGAWSWFKGMNADSYITAIITQGILSLQEKGINNTENNNLLESSIKNAINYLLNTQKEKYSRIVKLDKHPEEYIPDNEDLMIIYLLSISSYKEKLNKKELSFFIEQAKKSWKNYSLNTKINLAETLYNINDPLAKIITLSIKDIAIKNKLTGYYWKENTVNYGQGIETHTNAIELFSKQTNDTTFIKYLCKWLLLNNRSNYWSNTITTTKAINSLLTINAKINAPINTNIILGNQTFKLTDKNTESGTGYFKTILPVNTSNKDLSLIKIEQPAKQISYGALYWQYTEQIEKINKTNGDVIIDKKYFVKQIANNTEKWIPITATQIHLGDEIEVQLKITTHFPMQYIYVKDMRPSGTEPSQVISETKYQNNMWYYSSVSDAANNFYIHQLAKGTYTLSYKLKANNAGLYQTGIASIQCLYSPELTANSNSTEIKIIE